MESTRRSGDRVYHTHAKDVEIMYSGLGEVGIIGDGWWQYRIPGQGIINSRSFIAVLEESG